MIKTRRLYQCNRCHHQTSVVSGTIFEKTKLPLTKWFLAIHLITQSKTGLSALSLIRHLGVSYNTAWSMKQKVMQVMKDRDDNRYQLRCSQSVFANSWRLNFGKHRTTF